MEYFLRLEGFYLTIFYMDIFLIFLFLFPHLLSQVHLKNTFEFLAIVNAMFFGAISSTPASEDITT